MKKPVVIKDEDSGNIHVTDLVPLPSYHPSECPFYIKRGMRSLVLVDVKHKTNYVLYEDDNNKWGYNKVSVIDREFGRFQLLFLVDEGNKNCVLKKYDFPAIFEEGLKRISNLRHKEVKSGFFKNIFKIGH